MKVSVIIPVYKVKAYIEECLESVRKQTLKEIEIICIDDGGNDGSLEIVKNLAEQDKRICCYENHKNRGLAYSRNVGLNHAKGKYVYFLDADDMITPTALEELYETAEKDFLDAAVFCAEFIYEDEHLKEVFSSNPAVFKGDYPDILEGKALYIKWMREWDWMPSQPRYFYRREFLEKNNIRFIDGMLHEDETFAFDVLMSAKRIRVLKHAYFIRRFRKSSIMTGTITWKNVDGCFRILQHVTQKALCYKGEVALLDAISFYKKKITANAKGKIQVIQKEYDTQGSVVPTISVIIPVYNVAPYFRECLDSVIAQNITNLEIICVDDGSTDDSREIMAEYEILDPRIRNFYNEGNFGQSVARNCGLEQARGKYVYMLDADDKIADHALEDLIALCEKEQLDVIGFENRQFADSPEFQKQAESVLFTYQDVEGIYSGREAFITCVEKDVISPSVPTFLFRRDFLQEERLRFVEHILHEDIGFILEMFLKANRVQLIHKPYLLRRFRAHSTVTGGFAAKQMEGYLKSWQKYFSCYDEALKRFGNDSKLFHALDKWKRNVLGRIRMLYTESKENVYFMQGGNVDEETRQLLEVVRETTSTRDRAYAILGQDICDKLEKEGKVYVCGTGQYAHRIVELVGALDVEICGIFAKNRDKRTFCGFKVYLPSDVTDTETMVIPAVSHYQIPEYEKILTEAGFFNCLYVPF